MSEKKPLEYFAPERLRGLMQGAGVTLQALSDGTGLSMAAISGYLGGRCQPGLKALFALCDYFAVPLDFLTGRADEETARGVLECYNISFMMLRRASYEEYAHARRSLTFPGEGTYEAPWPYNLLNAITGEVSMAPLSQDQNDGMRAALESLSPRESAAVVDYYEYGLDVKKIGRKFHVSPERARQIIAKGVRKMAYPARKNMIIYGYEGVQSMNLANVRRRELAEQAAELDKTEEELKERRDRLIMRGVMLDEAERTYRENRKPPAPGNPVPLSFPTAEMDLSVRAAHVLMRAELDTLGKIILAEKEGRLVRLRNMGRKTHQEVVEKVRALLCLKSIDDIGGNDERFENAQ